MIILKLRQAKVVEYIFMLNLKFNKDYSYSYYFCRNRDGEVRACQLVWRSRAKSNMVLLYKGMRVLRVVAKQSQSLLLNSLFLLKECNFVIVVTASLTLTLVCNNLKQGKIVFGTEFGFCDTLFVLQTLQNLCVTVKDNI